MEFEEMQVIWDSQKEQPMQALDMDALHKNIQRKGRCLERQVGLTEWGMIAITLFVALEQAREPLLEGVDMHQIFGSVVMLAVGTWMWVIRRRRLNHRAQFEATLLGDLDRALYEADLHLRLAQSFQLWFMLPAMAIVALNWTVKDEVRSTGKFLLVLGVFALAMCVVRLGIRFQYLPTKRNLHSLRETLISKG